MPIRSFRPTEANGKPSGDRRNMIIAVDFDGVLVKDEFPRVGETDFEILNLVKKVQSQGNNNFFN